MVHCIKRSEHAANILLPAHTKLRLVRQICTKFVAFGLFMQGGVPNLLPPSCIRRPLAPERRSPRGKSQSPMALYLDYYSLPRHLKNQKSQIPAHREKITPHLNLNLQLGQVNKVKGHVRPLFLFFAPEGGFTRGSTRPYTSRSHSLV